MYDVSIFDNVVSYTIIIDICMSFDLNVRRSSSASFALAFYIMIQSVVDIRKKILYMILQYLIFVFIVSVSCML